MGYSNYYNCGCGNPNCTCGHNSYQGIYGTNMWNINGNQPGNNYSCSPQQVCNGCIDIIKDICVLYLGANLTSLGINTNDNFRTVLEKLNAIKVIQDTKNTNLLAAINDLNDRVNDLEGGTPHDPYTLL